MAKPSKILLVEDDPYDRRSPISRGAAERRFERPQILKGPPGAPALALPLYRPCSLLRMELHLRRASVNDERVGLDLRMMCNRRGVPAR